MSNHQVMCTATEKQAAFIINELRSAGFDSSEISVLIADKKWEHEMRNRRGHHSAHGIGAGTLLGAALGWLAGSGTLTIPGLGMVVAAGPLVGTLSGIALGATVGGVASNLAAMGIPEYDARQYEYKVKEGNALMSVYTHSDSERLRVREIFKRSKVRDVVVTEGVSAFKY